MYILVPTHALQMIQILSEEGVPWLGTVINLCFINNLTQSTGFIYDQGNQ